MPGRRHRREPHAGSSRIPTAGKHGAVAVVFLAGAVVTLGAGVALQDSGNLLAHRMGLQGAIFGATFLAAATALPEISSGIAAVRLGDMQLAVGDILGGNSFQITLFLARRPARRHAGDRRRAPLGRLARRARAADDGHRGGGDHRAADGARSSGSASTRSRCS